MRVPAEVLPDEAAIGEVVAVAVLERYAARTGRFLLGCPGGRSLRSSYQALGRQARDDGVDLSDLVVVMMDEYLVPGTDGELVAVDPTLPHSCRRFGQTEIVDRLPEVTELWLPDPADPAAYDERIAAAGGIGVFLLASGASDGHVAFNPPGTAADSRSRVITLPESTRRDNLATFPSFGGDLAAVPSHGVSVGVATIVEQSAAVIMVAHGAGKAEAVRRLVAADRYQPDWPATVVSECRAPRLVVDAAAHP